MRTPQSRGRVWALGRAGLLSDQLLLPQGLVSPGRCSPCRFPEASDITGSETEHKRCGDCMDPRGSARWGLTSGGKATSSGASCLVNYLTFLIPERAMFKTELSPSHM